MRTAKLLLSAIFLVSITARASAMSIYAGYGVPGHNVMRGTASGGELVYDYSLSQGYGLGLDATGALWDPLGFQLGLYSEFGRKTTHLLAQYRGNTLINMDYQSPEDTRYNTYSLYSNLTWDLVGPLYILGGASYTVLVKSDQANAQYGKYPSSVAYQLGVGLHAASWGLECLYKQQIQSLDAYRPFPNGVTLTEAGISTYTVNLRYAI